MELIKPAEISSKIMTLFDEADEELIIISPYNDLEHWVKMKRHLKMALKRGIIVEYYVRSNTEHKGIDDLSVNPVYIDNLHAKVYMNEKYAIISSMNLVRYSNDYSLDIGCLVNEKDELNNLRDFYKRYIKPYNTLTENKTTLQSNKIKRQNRDELIFKKYYSKIINGEFKKEYHPNSYFIKNCGFVSEGEKVNKWLFFKKNGLIEKTEIYDCGILKKTMQTKFDEEISLYDILFSVINIIGGLYEVSISDLYFDSFISDYTLGNNAKLYNYVTEILNIELSTYHYLTLQDLINDIKTRLSGGLSSSIRKEIILKNYLQNYLKQNENENLQYIKKYHYQTDFIKYCGFIKNNKDGFWLYFDKNGFCEREKIFDDGNLIETKYITYDENVSLYHIIFSLVNIVSGLYKKPVSSLYFNCNIRGYTNNNPQLLYTYIEKHLNIKLSGKEPITFQDLVDDIKWYLGGNIGDAPRF